MNVLLNHDRIVHLNSNKVSGGTEKEVESFLDVFWGGCRCFFAILIHLSNGAAIKRQCRYQRKTKFVREQFHIAVKQLSEHL